MSSSKTQTSSGNEKESQACFGNYFISSTWLNISSSTLPLSERWRKARSQSPSLCHLYLSYSKGYRCFFQGSPLSGSYTSNTLGTGQCWMGKQAFVFSFSMCSPLCLHTHTHTSHSHTYIYSHLQGLTVSIMKKR